MHQEATALTVSQITSLMVISLVTTMFLLFLLFLLLKIVKREIYKSKLKKIDLKEYVPMGFAKTGLPVIMQSRKDPNKLIFL